MTTETKNKMGLMKNQDNAIYIEQDTFEGWRVLRGKIGSTCSTVMFTFETETEAFNAGRDIAKAIGGEFYGTKDVTTFKSVLKP